MQQERDGAWRAIVDLPIGQLYEFYYVVDGERQTDYQADGFVSNISGTQKSIIHAALPQHRPQKEQDRHKELLHRKATMLRQKVADRTRNKAHLPQSRAIA